MIRRGRVASIAIPGALLLAACGLEDSGASDSQTGVSRLTDSSLSVRWTCERHLFARESDLWPVTWSDDGSMYAAWGDGWGFALDPATDPKKSYGISRIDGTGVSDLSGVDVHYGPSFAGNGKIATMVSADGALYLLFSHQDEAATLSLRKSTDGGRTIGEPLWSATEPDVGGFVQAGRNNEFAGGFVYATQDGGRLGDPDDVFLYRVAEGEVERKSAWETFTGLSDGDPTWGPAFPPNPRRVPILSLPRADALQVTRFRGLGKWIGLLNTGHDIATFLVLEADVLWGEWRLVEDHEGDGWCGWAGTSGRTDLHKLVAPRWISEDGRKFVLFASARNGSLVWDALVAIEGELIGPPAPDQPR